MLLTVIEARLAVCRVGAGNRVPDWVDQGGDFVSITRTVDELSIVCAWDAVPAGVPMEGPWRAIRCRAHL